MGVLSSPKNTCVQTPLVDTSYDVLRDQADQGFPDPTHAQLVTRDKGVMSTLRPGQVIPTEMIEKP